MLYPQENEFREVKDLSGIWRFRRDSANAGRTERWYEKPLKDAIAMPVPSSYNDITQDIALRNHIGDVWYERAFFVPQSWRRKKIYIRVGAATHHATVWINGNEAVSHKGGFLPFEGEISESLIYGDENRVTIVVNNVLDWSCLPPGELKTFSDPYHPDGYVTQEYFHDFFNYAGIHRAVSIYSVPENFIRDITVSTERDTTNGIIHYAVVAAYITKNITAIVRDENNAVIAKKTGVLGALTIPNAVLWEPGKPYLYSLCISIADDEGNETDRYKLAVGIRTVRVSGKQLLINDKPVYLQGFGMHEDMDIRGKGHDNARMVKDFNLLNWIGANSFRTSHYPYAEEIMQYADRTGMLVIDEAPAVGFNFFDKSRAVFKAGQVDENTLRHHCDVLRALYARDKNHPCVIIWSLTNEPASYEQAAASYFKKATETMRELDTTRPIMIVNNTFADECRVSQMFDIIGVNRYFGWYSDPGHPELIAKQAKYEFYLWWERFGKPVMLTEYGADAIEGLHADPPLMFSEEYQNALLEQFHAAVDSCDFIIGEHVWNFADFMTKEGRGRVMGNRKGIFTRQRQPKAAAQLLRARWHKNGK